MCSSSYYSKISRLLKTLKERKLVGVDINNNLITCKKDDWLKASNDNQPKPGVFAKNPRLKDVNWIANTTRGTNGYIHCSHLIYLYDQKINPVVARWLKDRSRAFNDAYALTELIQWVWRSRFRKGEPITLYLPCQGCGGYSKSGYMMLNFGHVSLKKLFSSLKTSSGTCSAG